MPKTTVTAVAALAFLSAAAPSSAATTAATARYGHEGRWITDQDGRVAMLHGFNMVNKMQATGYAPDAIGFGADDARFLARNGFNVVRLGVIWKAVEPQPGRYDEAYLARIERTAETLRRAGIAVMLDFHQDLYHERFGGEGAPDWAVVGRAATDVPAIVPGGLVNYALQDSVNHAYDAFWANTPVPETGRGVQDHFADAWAHVARRFAGQPGIVGLNLFNEPWQGSSLKAGLAAGCATSPRACGIPQFDAGPLTAFHRRVAKAIRRVDRRAMLWMAPTLSFDFGAESDIGRVDARGGFAFNAYCAQAAGLDFVMPYLQGKPCSFSAALSFKNAEAVTRRTGDALFLTEFGAGDDMSHSRDYLVGADDHMIGWAYWSYWNTDPSGPRPIEGLIHDIGAPPAGRNVKRAKLRELARPYPAFTAGTPTAYGFTPASRTFRLTYTPRRAGGGRAFRAGSVTEVALPRVQYPRGYAVHVRGARVVSAANAPVLRLALCRGAKRVTARVTRGTPAKAARTCGGRA